MTSFKHHRTWQVGELATATGLTVRALHHYEEIGLLIPSERSANGYRQYSEEDVRRLQQITALRDLGFSLEEIKTTLENTQLSPLQMMQMHAKKVEDQLNTQKELLQRLHDFSRLLEHQGNVSADALLSVIELSNTVAKYYTPEQMEYLKKRREEVGEEAIHSAEQEWPKLIAEAKAHMEKGTDPKHKNVQRIAKRWMELVESFTGGNPEIAANLRKMYEENPQASASFGGPDPKLMAYIQKAMND